MNTETADAVPVCWLQLDAGLRGSLEQAAHGLSQQFGVALPLRDDLELGGVHYHHAPQPVPERGIADLRVHVNHIDGFGWSLPQRQDLPTVMTLVWIGRDWLWLGRTAEALRSRFGAAFDVAACLVQTHGDDPRVRVEPAAGSPPALPLLQQELRFAAPARMPLEALRQRLRDRPEWVLGDAGDGTLTVSFASSSLLDLGRCARRVEQSAPGVRACAWRVDGDVWNEGRPLRLHLDLSAGG